MTALKSTRARNARMAAQASANRGNAARAAHHPAGHSFHDCRHVLPGRRLRQPQQHVRRLDDRDLRRARLRVREIQIPDLAHGAGRDPRADRRDGVRAKHDRQRQRLDGVLQGTDLRHADGRLAAGLELSVAAGVPDRTAAARSFCLNLGWVTHAWRCRS